MTFYANLNLLQDEFVFCWSEWIKKVARPSSALVVVDVQNDFISGSLAIINCPAGQNGEDVRAWNILSYLFLSEFIEGSWEPIANDIDVLDVITICNTVVRNLSVFTCLPPPQNEFRV